MKTNNIFTLKGKFMIKYEGKNAVKEALNSNVTIEKILVFAGTHDDEIMSLTNSARRKNVKVQYVPLEAIKRESVTGKAQNIIAFSEDFEYCTVNEILKYAKDLNKEPFIVILDGIEDPHNLGSIIRVCECLGVHGIIIGKNRACQVNETVIKTSAGATSHMKIARVTNINYEIQNLKEQNVWVYACELGGLPLSTTTLTGAIAIVIGSEGNGVSQLTKQNCDGVFTIEMCGKVNSLNASVATGIAIYEVAKQRGFK